MKNLILFFGLLFSLNSFAASSGSGNVSNVAGSGAIGANTQPISFVSIPSNVVVFSIYVGDWSTSFSANHFWPFYKNGVAYQVTAGKSAYCFDIRMAEGLGSEVQLVSATASFSKDAASITGGVYQAGSAGAYSFITNGTNNALVSIPGFYQFGSSTWPGVQAAANTSHLVHMDCYEQ